MHLGHESLRRFRERRTLLVAGGASVVGIHGGFSQVAPATNANASPAAKARSTILVWLSGGASHIDMWDMKPDAPSEYRGEFKPIATSSPGLVLCEHLPLLAKQAHHFALVNSLGHYRRGTGDHHAGYYYNLTGHWPDSTFPALLNARTPYPTDWPFMGSVVAAKRSPHPHLPQLVTLPQKPGAPEYTRPGQFAARLGPEFDPVYVLGQRERPLEFTVPALTLEGEVSAQRLLSRRSLLGTIDLARRDLDRFAGRNGFSTQQEKAFSLLGAPESKIAFDVTRETLATRARYGETVNGMSMLMARRLVEAGVPFVSVFWQESPVLDKLCASGGGWDTHGNNFGCLRDHLLPEFDRCFSALIEDMAERGILDSTLVLVNSEMGRKPKIGDVRSGGIKGAGRDHWTHCMTALLAGGGIRGGQVYGTSDPRAEYPADRPVAPEDITKTVYRLMGIHDLEAVDREGRPFHLLPEGAPLLDLIG